jgi:competence protein ComEC
MYFQGIGASGFVTGAIKTVEAPHSGGLSLRYAAFMQGLRDAIDARIRTALDGDKRAIATALLTGRRDAITTPVNDAMFISGLGHVLSISGYHMAVVAGVVFFAVRALLALIPQATAAGADPAGDRWLSDQEVVGGGSSCGCLVLSSAVGL